ncbi:hypothetical protein POM88_006937 [Heracleum sosnowskyi]|uniref:Replication factor A C-terminal domain-containing protein n=1 Tax=Heracleum sosnowskyi TaxID=360622 RepID=A0AAD8J3N9_9APIA|nr:hypothetical protein POM88_006937 [Heracleum sosnowskyi]
MDTWFHHVCTSCYNESKIVGTDCYCNICKRIVPHPDKWFELWVLASDETGQLDIMLENVPARKCLGKSVREIGEMIPKVQFPQILKSIENKEYTIKLLIREENIREKSKLYRAKDIMEGPYMEEYDNLTEETHIKPIQESYGEGSGSTYHLDSMSENN